MKKGSHCVLLLRLEVNNKLLEQRTVANGGNTKTFKRISAVTPEQLPSINALSKHTTDHWDKSES